MRWGITDEYSIQASTTKICLDEIRKCVNQSMGPSFVAFVSHRYGGRFLKPLINKDQFELILNEMKSDGQLLIRKCYSLNENQAKMKYELKSIQNICETLKIDVNEWREKEKIAIGLMRDAANKAFEKNKFDKKLRDSYFTSVTHQEIEKGILNNPNANDTCVCFMREIRNSESADNSKSLNSFIDNDVETNALLDELKNELEKKLSEENIIHMRVDWDAVDGFKVPYTDKMKQYLNEFGENFKRSVINLIDHKMKQFETSKDTNKLDSEILHHAIFCNKLCNRFHERPSLIERVKAYLDDKSNTKPFIITGLSGSGKSSLVAYCSKKLKKPNDVVLLRFLGTSRVSSSMSSVFVSLKKQLNEIYNSEPIHNTETSTNISEIRNDFIKQLKFISENQLKSRLIIILDAIDQLSQHDHSLNWMFYDLPKNVKIIYSVLSDYNDILNMIKTKIDLSKTNYLSIDHLDINESQKILTNWLEISKAKLTNQQSSAIRSCLSKASEIQPLHVKILFDIALKWSSYDAVNQEILKCTSTKSTIHYLLERLELVYGEVLVSRCVFYLTLFEYTGISEPELEDILSIDDVVLNSVFKHYHPPIRRFLISLWLNIKYELKDYLTKKENDDVLVISWFHRAFIEASQEYYENMFSSCDLKDSLLMNIIDYFTEKWNEVRANGCAGEKKLFEYKTKRKLSNFERSPSGRDNEYLAYRYTKPQNMEFVVYNSRGYRAKFYNKRKLNELINVISMLQDTHLKVKLLKENVYLNYEFMIAKAELRQIDFVIEMHENLIRLAKKLGESNEDVAELVKVSDIYKNQYQKMQLNPKKTLCLELLSRIQTRSTYIEEFAKPSGLILQYGYVDNEVVRSIYCVDSNNLVRKLYPIHNSGYLFIEISSKIDSFSTVLLFDSETTKILGSIELKKKIDSLQISFNDNIEKLKQFTNLNGSWYFTIGSVVYSCDFNSNSTIVKKFDGDVKEILLLSSAALLVQNEKSLSLMSLNDLDKVFEVDVDSKIELLRATISKDVVYPSNYLNNFDLIGVFIGLTNKTIKVYLFNTKTQQFYQFCKVDSIEWNNYGLGEWLSSKQLTWREFLLIDECSNSIKLNETNASIRFAIDSDHSINVFEIDNEGKHRIVVEINEDMLEITSQDKKDKPNEQIQLEGFCKNRVIVKLLVGDRSWNIYVFDTEKKKFMKTYIKAFRINSLRKCKCLFAQYYGDLRLYEITDTSIDLIIQTQRLNFESTVFNEVKTEMIIKGNKLSTIEPQKRHSIDQFDFSKSNSNSTKSQNVAIKSILYTINSKHVIVDLKRADELFEIAIVDVNDRSIIQSLHIKEKECYVKPIGFTKEKLILAINDCLSIYNVTNSQNKYSFNEIFNEKIAVSKNKTDDLWNLDRCWFDFYDSTVVLIGMYDQDEDKIKMKTLNYKDLKSSKHRTAIVSLKDVDINHSRLQVLVTCKSRYLVLWSRYEKKVFYMDVSKDKLLNKIKSETNIETRVVCIPNTDNLIVKLKNKLVYFELDQNTEFTQFAIKNYKPTELQVEISNEYLIIDAWNDGFIELFNLKNIIHKKFALNTRISKQVWHYSITTDGKYLSIQTKSHELYVYKLYNMKEMACVQFNDKFKCLKSTDKYTLMTFDDKLISFLIVNDD